jgi:hypothetical protein
VRSAKLKIARMDLRSPSIREYRMECTGDTHRTVRTAVTGTVTRSVTRTATRTVVVVAAGAALVAGGVAAARTEPAGAPVATPTGPTGPTGPTAVLAALPHSIGASNRAW